VVIAGRRESFVGARLNFSTLPWTSSVCSYSEVPKISRHILDRETPLHHHNHGTIALQPQLRIAHGPRHIHRKRLYIQMQVLGALPRSER
jgi:hypothetical protein